MSKPETLPDVIDQTTRAIEACDATLAKFRERFDTDPRGAFESAENAVADSIRRHHLRKLRDAAARESDDDPAERLAAFKQYFEREARGMADRIPRSSSPISNMMVDHERAILWQIAGWFNDDLSGRL